MLIANDPSWIYFHDYNKTAPCGMITVFLIELNQLYIYRLFLPQLMKSYLN